ncbi:tetratricopeptide repeat protein [Consotaella salsifontis]|uniref:Tetratricopeptide repeat-containing protein n=1 Tax=Consotaella salsifontis TaxID=1365950 RepID=A0A1T4N006_9HYPH|nr:tetratricopeptide repeat protein [Consotaella salsifontis]SJZ72690.1 Tetratricopeptide repeat-containing protein [Consotaella salsifontis]
MQTPRFFRLVCAGALILATAPVHTALASGGQPASSDRRPEYPAHSLAGAYLAAKSAQLAGDLSTATQYYSQALSLDPKAEELQQDALFAFLADGRFEEGVELASKLRNSSEASKVARITLGVDALRHGEFDRAIKEFDIPNLSDLDALLLGHLSAWAEVGAGHVDEAMKRLDGLKGVAWYPIFNDYQRGLMAAYAERQGVARQALSRVLNDETGARTSADAYLAAAEALARIEARSGNRDAAIAALDKGLALSSDYDPLVRLRERINAGETIEPPIANVRQGVAETLYILGQAVNRGEGQQVALLYFQLAHAAAPADSLLLVALAGIAERSERLDLAISYYSKIPEDSALRRTADLQMGLDLWYSKKKDEAKEHLNQALKRYPRNLQAHLALADVLSADKDYQGAAKILDEAVKLIKGDSRSSWNVYYQRGIAYERQGKWDKAEPNFKKALELVPNQPQVLNYLGYSWVDMNRNLKEGLEMIRKAVELRPNDGYIIDSLGWAYYRMGRYDESVEQLERAILLNPADPTINDHLGDAYWQVGRKREARFQWQRALSGDPKPEAKDAQRIAAKISKGLDQASNDARSNQPPANTPAGGAATATTPDKPSGDKPAQPDK